MKQVFKWVKPGGWVEFQDFDTHWYTSTNGTFTKDSLIGEWSSKIREGLRKFGVEPDPGPHLETWVKEAGFVNVTSQTNAFPMGTWPKDRTLKEIGAFNLISFLDNLEGISLRLYEHAWGWSPEEIKILCAKLRPELKDPKKRMQHNYYVVYAQKPEDAVD